MNDLRQANSLPSDGGGDPTIAFFGHFGTRNTGNESTLLAILSHLRQTFPGARFLCVCTNPDAVTATYGIDAVAISNREARLWDRRLGFGLRVVTAFAGVAEEVTEYVRAYRTLRETDTLIVPGTGLLTDAYGLSGWGPYNLCKWTLMAKARRCRVLFVNVGAGPIYSLPGRLLVRSALSVANYRSFRDTSSTEYLDSIGLNVTRDPIYPDLAFSLQEPAASGHSLPAPRRVVGLGLMVFDGKLDAEASVRETYAAYLNALRVFVEWLLERDYDVRLLLGDGDTPAIDDFTSLLQARGAYDAERVIAEPIGSVPELLAQIAACDVVVATRFHNVLLALLVNRPVIAISFHHKVASLMYQMGLRGYCQDIRRLDAGCLIDQFQEVERDNEKIKKVIRKKVDEFRRALDEQHAMLFNRS